MELIIRCRVLLLVLLSCFAINTFAAQKTLLVYGDSLSAAYGIDINQGWVALLKQKLRHSHPEWQVINVSISGETTAGGLSRLPAVLDRHQPDLMILELGANDGLRGTNVKVMKSNLLRMTALAQAQQSRVLLFEMQMPPNYGKAFTRLFTKAFHDVAKARNISLVPFFLDGVAGHPALNQPDGIHPTAEAQPRLLDNIWPTLESELNAIKKAR